MTDETSAPAGGEAVPAADAPAQYTGGELTVSEAARLLGQSRHRKESAPAEAAEAPAVEKPELAQANAAPETAPSEEPEAIDPVEEPPIDPPRSWTKAEKERFQSLPRETQEYLHTREQEREREVRRTQNEAADIRKAAEAERKQAEEARKAYEAKLPALMESLQRQSEFADIRTMEDVRKLQLEDPFRFQAWQVYQMDAQAVDQERRNAEQRQQQERINSRNTYAREQDQKLQDLIPEMKDPAKANEIRSKAVAMLVDDYGFTESELGAIMSTDDGFRLLSDARLQKLIADGLKYAEIRKAPPKAAPKPVPPVQRPGTSRPQGNAASERIQALQDKFNRTGSLRDAQELRAAQMRRA